MKKLLIGLLITFIGLCSNYLHQNQLSAQPGGSVSFQVFYDNLSPYGHWVQNPQYGYCWQPSVGDFTPYASGGHWEYADDGSWIWVSTYDWGWAPFHYGRWFMDPSYGWMWVPGYDWAPAWVQWGNYDDYYGWAPLGVGVTFSTGYRPPSAYWNFVPRNRIYESNVYNYRVHNTTIVRNNITIINNTRTYGSAHYAGGPRAADVEKATGRKVAPVRIAEQSRPGATRVANNQVSIYRPKVDRTASAKAAPPKVEKMESLPHNAPARTAQPAKTAAPATRQNQPNNQQKTAPVRNTNAPQKTVNQQPVKANSTAPQRTVNHAPVQQTPHQQQTNPVQHQAPQNPQQPRSVQRNNAPVQHQQAPPQQHQPAPQRQQMAPAQHQQMAPPQQHQQMAPPQQQRAPEPQRQMAPEPQRQAAPELQRQMAPEPQHQAEPMHEAPHAEPAGGPGRPHEEAMNPPLRNARPMGRPHSL